MASIHITTISFYLARRVVMASKELFLNKNSSITGLIQMI